MERTLISCMQRIVLYETKTRFYLVGSNNSETRFRILKIDRTEPRDLIIHDDNIEYSLKQIRSLLVTLDVGNRSRSQRGSGTAGLLRTVSAFGIVGFVRFLEGHYIILITKRRKSALIGQNIIYKIEDTSMIYIPNDTVRISHQEENRYVKIFQNVDLSSNFYFSYSYDLTHTLQYNMTPSSNLRQRSFTDQAPTHEDPVPIIQQVLTGKQLSSGIEDAGQIVVDCQDIALDGSDTVLEEVNDQRAAGGHLPQGSVNLNGLIYGVKNEPSWKYVWNQYLIDSFKDNISTEWIIYITHGFIGQVTLNVFGKLLFLSVIARRSNKFAGTRFLKRGGNCNGDVANFVETEQILQDSSILSLDGTRISSFTQCRGSIPLFWSQDIAKMMPKPAILIDQGDPFGYIGGLHFNEVLQRYGSPVVVLDLVKKKEKNRKHESILRDEFINTVDYLNQFLPADLSIQHIGFDMASINKNEDTDVFDKLKSIAEYCVRKTGFFYNRPFHNCHPLIASKRGKKIQSLPDAADNVSYQTGVVRTNCVDCLDRTNTAQFAIGKTALGYQLDAMSVIGKPVLEFDTECVRRLEELYEDQGDTLALQYGGSQLVHRIETYRKSAQWTTHSRDIMHTLSRYYSNAFSDADKQNAINVFLGVYKPHEHKYHIWELATDFYMHNVPHPTSKNKSYSQWYSHHILKYLPLPYEQCTKGVEDKSVVVKIALGEKVDIFREYYRTYEFTSLDDVPSRYIQGSSKSTKQIDQESPFAQITRKKANKDKDECKTGNPNVTGNDSTSSITSEGSTTSSSSDDSNIDGDVALTDNSAEFADCDQEKSQRKSKSFAFKNLFASAGQMYGISLNDPAKSNMTIYRKYVQIWKNATHPLDMSDISKGTTLIRKSAFPCDSTEDVTPPTLSKQSRELYNKSVVVATCGPQEPSKQDLKIYNKYVADLYR